MFQLLRRREQRVSNSNAYVAMRGSVKAVVPDTTVRCVDLDSLDVLGFSSCGSLLLGLQTAQRLVGFRVDALQSPTKETPRISLLLPKPLVKDFLLLHKHTAILASTEPHKPQNNTPSIHHPNQLLSTKALEDIHLYLVCLTTGVLLDTLTFTMDHIILNHMQGVQIRNDFLAVTSVKYQTIHLFHIQPSGRFVKLREIGWHNSDDDALLIANARLREDNYWKEHDNQPNRLHQQQQQYQSHFVPATVYRHLHPTAPAPDEPDAPAGGPIRGVDMRRSVRRVGRSTVLPRVVLNQEDPDLLRYSNLPPRPPVVVPPPMPPVVPVESYWDHKTRPLSGLKQRLMTFLYRQALDHNTPSALRHFYLTFDQYTSLVLWRMQFIDDDTILLKLGGLENTSGGRNAEPASTQPCFYVLYRLESTQVVSVFSNTSQSLLDLYTTCPQLRGLPAHPGQTNFITSACNNAHAREFVKKQLYSVRKAKNGGVAQAVKRVLGGVGVNPQCWVTSPLLDQAVFAYDEGVISNLG
ncbi:acid phosphatase det1, partial [Podochytrium sp. JEL0797]